MNHLSPKPGADDAISDIPGLKIGHAHDDKINTGVTVILPDTPCPMAVDVRGGGPGTRELEALDPSCVVSSFHALVLSGGSVFGLDAAGAVVNWLSNKGRGLDLMPRTVPVVPSAILYDLGNGGDKDWGEEPPYRKLARQACETATYDGATGRVGAGYGATSGHRQGGIGMASLCLDDGLCVAAMIAVNSFGDVYKGDAQSDIPLPKVPMAGLNTTIGCVATNATLDKGSLKRLAMMAQDGYARSIRPIHTLFDGDTIFALGTATHDKEISPLDLSILGTMAADCVVKAVHRAVGI